MVKVSSVELPLNAFLARYSERGYTDCFVADVPEPVSMQAFVEAFYTTWLFKIERFILRVAAKRPSTDLDVAALACGACDKFAAWDVEQRAADQLLMCDMGGHTRSWLHVAGTRLYFGSAVVANETADGKKQMGWIFRDLLGFHKVYSILLLRCAVSRLARM